MSVAAEQQARILVDGTFGVLLDCLGVTVAFEDDIDDLVAILAEEIDMWLSAAAVMPDWTQPIGWES